MRTFAPRFATVLFVAVSFVLTLALMGIATAGTQAATSAADARADARASAIAPFVNAQTLAVGYLDVSRVDLNAVEAFALEALKQWAEEGENLDSPTADLHQGMEVARQWAGDFQRAGGRSVYWVIHLEDVGGQTPGLFVFPLVPGGDAQKLTQYLQEKMPAGANLAELHGALAIGAPEVLDRYQDFAAAPRAELGQALDAAGADAAGAYALIPTPESVQELIAMAPPELGNTISGPVQGLRWAALGATAPAQESVQFVAQAQDAAAAQAVSAIVNMGLASWQQMAARQKMDIAGLVKAITPQVAEDRLTTRLDKAAIAQLMRDLTPVMRSSRQQAKTMASMSNMRQLLIAMMMFANDNKGEAPENLESLAVYLGGQEILDRLMTNPARPQQKPGYVYVRPAGGKLTAVPQPAERLVLYEAFDDGQWPDRVSVGFADGHVEAVSDEAAFRRLLEQAQKPTPASDGDEKGTPGAEEGL